MRRIIMFVLLLGQICMGLVLLQKPASAAAQIDIVVLGDSYTAGNGALDYYGKDGCYQSSNNYSRQFEQQLGYGGFETSYHIRACTGAVTEDLMGQVGSLHSDIRHAADLVFVTSGGNDMRFADIAIQCFIAMTDSVEDCKRLLSDASNGLDGVMSNLKTTLRDVQAEMPNARVVLLGYPYLVANCPDDEIYTIDGFASGETVRELGRRGAEAQKKLIAELNNTYPGKFMYVDVRSTFSGHEICGEKEPYIRDAYDTTVWREWFHPNLEGHTAEAILLYSSKVHSGLPLASEPPPAPTVEEAPSTEEQPSYKKMPFACGTVVPYASTYDSFWYEGRTIYHSLSLDMPMPSGTEVVAPEAGTAYVRSDPYGYGNFIDVAGDSGVKHRLAHLKSVAIGNGQRVGKGRVVGRVGSTGASTGPHLHYEKHYGGKQVAPDMIGPTLQWGPKIDSTGFRKTTHALVSGNCSSGSGGSGSDRYADILTHEYGNIRYGRSDGYDNSNWEIGLEHITKPYWSASCDFDNDGWDEYISYEKHLAQFALADPKGNGKFRWRIISTGNPNAREFTCGDWNRDGRDDLIMHNTKGYFYIGFSDGTKVYKWKRVLTGIGPPTYLDACDINGDGQVEVISYEGWGNQLMVGKRGRYNTMKWRKLLDGIYHVGGMTCGNFTGWGPDELVVWQPEENGRYMIGQFDGSYRRVHWDPLRPTGLSKPYKGELVSGDIDGDGRDEFVVNEYRPARNNHSVMVGDFTRSRRFSWHAFIEGIRPKKLQVGNFVG